MKKLVLTIAIVLGMGIGAFAQTGGVFGYGGDDTEEFRTTNEENESLISLPGSHGGDGDSPAPLGSGALLLIGLGAGYAMTKKRKA